jgi:hypothetical protein
MDPTEKSLFDLIDNARVSNGCARLKQDPNLTHPAHSKASSRAQSGKDLNTSSGSELGAGGDKMSAQQAYDRLMSNNRSAVLNCGYTTLGVGSVAADYKTGLLCPLVCSTNNRRAWVADFS